MLTPPAHAGGSLKHEPKQEKSFLRANKYNDPSEFGRLLGLFPQGIMRVTLTVVTGPHEGKVFTLSGHEMFLVGRSKRCHFQLDRKDMYFSRAHFLIEANPPLCRLSDMGSRNGTYRNGKRVAE